MNSIYCTIYIYIHKNLFASQAPDLLENKAECLLYNHCKHILLKLKIKKLLQKISSKNLTAGVEIMFDYSIIRHFRFLIDLMTDVISLKLRIEIINPRLAEAGLVLLKLDLLFF